MKRFLWRGYSCFIREKTYCQLKFREAAVVDNFNGNFAYPFCNCTEEKSGFVKGTICDGTEIDWNVNIYIAQGYDNSYVLNKQLRSRHFETIPLMTQTDTFYCTYEYNVTEYGEFFHCKRDDKAIPMSMMCIYAVDVSGYMTGCRSGDHLQHCENFTCPENTVKCPGSYCIEQRFLCDGHHECPGGEDEQDCTCGDSDREVILFVENDDSESREAATHLAKQFFTNNDNNTVRLFYF
ncbi:vitellogenin receptor-like [Ruditapes philippinarum]|uniref:vitellogenin receptor-like n=1 Tax=Ruditapes philippinarum TaxID=129788 RepID=UPI00295BF58E|nr:vitellogenin receptor-like [Ruditapes philippinarum]